MDETSKKLIDAASDLLNSRGDGIRHTVATAATTKTGKVFTTLNVSHFTGGPCAEIAALAKLISEGEEPIRMVTVGDQGRGVIALCGRCRQVFLDYYPDVEIIMPDGSIKTPKQLLPDAYSWLDQQVVSKSE